MVLSKNAKIGIGIGAGLFVLIIIIVIIVLVVNSSSSTDTSSTTGSSPMPRSPMPSPMGTKLGAPEEDPEEGTTLLTDEEKEIIEDGNVFGVEPDDLDLDNEETSSATKDLIDSSDVEQTSYTDDSGDDWLLYENKKFAISSSTEDSPIVADNAEACLSICKDTEGCVGVTYNSVNQNCFIKNMIADGGLYESDNKTSYILSSVAEDVGIN